MRQDKKEKNLKYIDIISQSIKNMDKLLGIYLDIREGERYQKIYLYVHVCINEFWYIK